MGRMILFVIAIGLGVWTAFRIEQPPPSVFLPLAQPSSNIAEHKSFVFFVYAANQEFWCVKTLRSIFEQDYEQYRVILVDDASLDETEKRTKDFLVENQQEGKVLYLRNEVPLGFLASFYRAIDNCLDREIVISLEIKDFLAHNRVLQELNLCYQDPSVWLLQAPALLYPSYERIQEGHTSFYAALFKTLNLADLYPFHPSSPRTAPQSFLQFLWNGREKSSLAETKNGYVQALCQLAKGRAYRWKEPLFFFNEIELPLRQEIKTFKPYAPLSSFPSLRSDKKADVLIYSSDHPMQLYACLESILRSVSSIQSVRVVYQSSHQESRLGYEKAQKSFPQVSFFSHQEGAFQKVWEEALFDSPSEYVLFLADHFLVKDWIDLRFAVEQLERSRAFGFYLGLGKNLSQSSEGIFLPVPDSQPILPGVFAWKFGDGKGEWQDPFSLDGILIQKERLQNWKKWKYPTFLSLQKQWREKGKEAALGLYFEHSKLLGIKGVEESGFLEGKRVDIEPFLQRENRSLLVEY